MEKSFKFKHPGSVLAHELALEDLSANAFAGKLKVPTNRITAIINQQRSITPDTALRLSRFFGTTPEFWLNLQMHYDLYIAKLLVGTRINNEVIPNTLFKD